MAANFKIMLGSSSTARRQILADMGYEFTIMTADIDERTIRKDKPEELVMALAEAKADAIISRLQTEGSALKEDDPPTLLITADTVVVCEGRIREKPSSKEEAREFIKGYSGHHADVIGSVLVTNLKTRMRQGGWERAEVHYHDIPAEIINSLVDDAIILHVAGALILEHPLTSPFVKEVIGTDDNVMGLSKSLTEKLIQKVL